MSKDALSADRPDTDQGFFRHPRIAVTIAAGLLVFMAACDPDRGVLGPAPKLPDIHRTQVEGVVTAKDGNGSLKLDRCLPGNAAPKVSALKAARLSVIRAASLANTAECTTTLPTESVADNSNGPPVSLAQAAAVGDVIVRLETIGQGNMTTYYAWQNDGSVLPG